MKKLICVIMVLLMCSVVLLTGCNGDKNGKEKGSVLDAANFGTQSSNKIETIGEEVSISDNSDFSDDVSLFINNKYYLTGTMYSVGEEGYPLALATDGKNIQVATSSSGISFTFLMLEDETYVVVPATKEYTKLNKDLLKALGMDDISLDTLQGFNASEDDIKEAKEKQVKVLINGKEGYCITFEYPDTVIKLYTQNDKLVQVDYFDETGNLTTQIVIDTISATIPADQLTLKGLTSVSAYKFISSLTSGIVAQQ